MDIIVHVGPHKTATTSLQHFLYDNRAALLGCGVCYPVISPDVPNKISHNDLAASMIAGDDAKTSTFLDAIEEAGLSSHHVVLSGEDFSACINTKMDEGLRILEGRFPNVRYIFVDRDNADRFTSAVVHMLAETPQSLYRYGSLSAYINEMASYSVRQRAFFERRSATFIAFKDFVSGGAGRALLKEAVGLEFEGQPVTANTASIYTDKLNSLPEGEMQKLLAFVTGNPSSEDVAADVSAMIKDRVATSLRSTGS
jgi:hypothetical protein